MLGALQLHRSCGSAGDEPAAALWTPAASLPPDDALLELGAGEEEIAVAVFPAAPSCFLWSSVCRARQAGPATRLVDTGDEAVEHIFIYVI